MNSPLDIPGSCLTITPDGRSLLIEQKTHRSYTAVRILHDDIDQTIAALTALRPPTDPEDT